jgi:5-hydroxyisourate hydrolase
MTAITTHVLDAALGRPAAGVRVRLEGPDGTVLGEARTDAEGRVRDFGSPALRAGTHRLAFATGDYFASRAQPTFYPEIVVTFSVTAADEHHHVPLLLSPFAYSTYRGS